MVAVATGLDVPIKLVWPKSLAFSSTSGFSMLGLGDIVIPGAFISLALRFDLQRSPFKSAVKPFSKPYFTSALVAYVLGLTTTIVVMHKFRAAQPALLYLRFVALYILRHPRLTFSKVQHVFFPSS